jgi:hypothetical protein
LGLPLERHQPSEDSLLDREEEKRKRARVVGLVGSPSAFQDKITGMSTPFLLSSLLEGEHEKQLQLKRCLQVLSCLHFNRFKKIPLGF